MGRNSGDWAAPPRTPRTQPGAEFFWALTFGLELSLESDFCISVPLSPIVSCFTKKNFLGEMKTFGQSGGFMWEYGWHLMGSDDAAWVPSPCLCDAPSLWSGEAFRSSQIKRRSCHLCLRAGLHGAQGPRNPGGREGPERLGASPWNDGPLA